MSQLPHIQVSPNIVYEDVLKVRTGLKARAPVVRRPISANPKLNFNLGLFIPLFKSLFGIVSCLLFIASYNHILDKKNSTEFSFKLSDLKLNFTLTLGYLNLALKTRRSIVFALLFSIGGHMLK